MATSPVTRDGRIERNDTVTWYVVLGEFWVVGVCLLSAQRHTGIIARL